MCTSLLYFDATNNAYLGRTMELSVELPYQVSFVPKNVDLVSDVSGFSAVKWSVQHPYLAITMPADLPQPGQKLGANDMKVIEGVNAVGLTFSVQSYTYAGGEDPAPDATQSMLSAIDLGGWVLSQFSTVFEVKEALKNQPVFVPEVPLIGGLKMPFHYGVRDAQGNTIIIEFHYGVRNVYDNPVGVMTNAPQFPWHLTNLNNYTYLTNIDKTTAKFGSYDAEQPDPGIAKSGLPTSDTAVDRFVRAVFYTKYAEKKTDPDRAVEMVAHIMNNFDRPRGISISPPIDGESTLHMVGQEVDKLPTESTSWTSVTDLARRRFYVRGNGGMNYVDFDVSKLADTVTEFHSVDMAKLAPKPVDATSVFA